MKIFEYILKRKVEISSFKSNIKIHLNIFIIFVFLLCSPSFHDFYFIPDITSNTTNVPIFHAKFIKSTTDNNNNNSDEMDYKFNRKSINDLPLPPSPETLTTLENSNNDRIEDLNNIKLILMKPKRAEDNIYVNNNVPGLVHVKNNNPDNST
jgi:hypothetical protein